MADDFITPDRQSSQSDFDLSDSIMPEDESNNSFYGIATRNPFDDQVDVNDGFFNGDHGLEKLQQAKHLCQFGANILFVNGDLGSGKTFFIQQILADTANTANCCYIEAGNYLSDQYLASEIAKQFNIDIPSSGGIRELTAAIQSRQSLSNLDRYVVAVDDIDLLGEGIIANLINCSQLPGSYHLILGGTPSVLDNLSHLELPANLVKISLHPYTLHETRDYLNFKMQSAGYHGEDYFDGSSIKSLHKRSGGYPAAINEAAEQLLFSQGMEDNEDIDRPNGFPLLHIGGLTFLLFVLILAFFYSGSDDPAQGEQLQLAIQDSIDNPPSAAPANTEQLTLANNDSQQDTATNPIQSSTETSEIVANNSTVTNTTNTPQTIDVEEPQTTQAPVDELASSEQTTTATDPVKPISSTDLKTQSSNAANSYSKDEQIVMAWPDGQLSLQVIGAYDKKSLESYRQQQPNKDDLLLLTVPRDDKAWHILVTGLYSSNSEAVNAIQQLPQAQINDSPWVRKTATLKQQIASFHNK